MKTAILVTTVLCASAALGQSIGGGSFGSPVMSQPYTIITHDQHASFRSMAQEQSLTSGDSGVFVAQGEIPLAEVPLPKHPEMPLGDVARLFRQQHESAKKAAFVFEQQGK